MKKNLFLLLFFFQITYSNSANIDYLLDAKKLYNIQETQEKLFKIGFKKVCFETQDSIKLCGLFLDKSDKEQIKGTIIYVAGFYPGLKEGMASFYSLVIDQPYNILLFDARGHNESEGDFLSYKGLKDYGQNEYLDIVAAIQFVEKHNQKNKSNSHIIIHGICSGAYMTIKAMDYLNKNNYPELKNINAIIFDSGWFKLEDIAKTSIYAEIKKRLKNSWFSWATQPISFITYQIYNLLFAKNHNKLPDIYESIQKINCPIFFVHCDNDPYVPIEPVQKFTQKCNCKYFWWIPHHSHANYHMHNYDSYKEKLLEFLNVVN